MWTTGSAMDDVVRHTHGGHNESRPSARSLVMRSLKLKLRRLLSGARRRPGSGWPCKLHDHAMGNCATCEALIG
jgi:hypothetical protein